MKSKFKVRLSKFYLEGYRNFTLPVYQKTTRKICFNSSPGHTKKKSTTARVLVDKVLMTVIEKLP